ncbi:MAG: TolC family protein [Flavobacteriales bacterium]|nr:TolC family protein [Flavobacteriales bacterium]
MIKNITIFLFICFISLTVYGQDKLSLADAIQMGLKNNYEILIGGKNIEIADRNNNWLEAGALPSISVSTGYDNNWSKTDNPASFIQGDPATSDNNGYGMNLNWVLFNGFKVHITKSKLQKLQEQSEGNLAIVVENTIQSIVLTYYDALVQEQKLSALKSIVLISNDRLKFIETKNDVGNASLYELSQAKKAMLVDSTNYLLQDLAFKNALRNLNMLMAIDVEKQFLLTDKLILPNVDFDLEKIKSKMLFNNQTLKNQYINQEILKKDKDLIKANLFPVVSFGSGTNYSLSSFEQGQFSSKGNTSLSYYANISLSFKLFDGHKNHRLYNNMRIKEEIAQLTSDQMKLKLINSLATNYNLYTTRKDILRLTGQTLEAAEVNLKIATEKFQKGTIGSFEYRGIQQEYLDAAITQFEATYNALNTYTDIVRLTGGIVEEFGDTK